MQNAPDWFTVGITRIALASGKELGEGTLGIFREALAPQTNAGEWESFSRASVASGRWRWFPTVRELLDALREFRGAPRIEAEAVLAYERVLESGSYGPEGTYWHFQEIAARCGAVAAEAFIEAGGHSAFSASDGGGYRDTERQKRFVAAYQAAARAEPSARLLPAATPQRFLPAGDAAQSAARDFEPISRGEAADLLAKIAGLNASENEEAHG